VPERLIRIEQALAGLTLPSSFWALLFVLGAILVAVLLHGLLFRFLLNRTDGRQSLAAGLLRRARRPIRLVFVLTALALAVPNVSLPAGLDQVVRQGTLVLIIVLIGWTLILLTGYFTERSLRRHRLDTEDNLRARKFITQLRVLRRAVDILIILVTAAVALMTFESVRQYGVSLFASAGVAGLVVGLAARPVLSNLIAGIQIALTQPIRIEDVVIVEGEWGWIEEIFATFVVVRLWDWRRMVVPLTWFIEQPFQNWTRETASVIGSVFWYLDYTVPVDAVRKKMTEIVTSDPRWDGNVVNLQVTETDRETVTLRGLMSARNSPTAWDLRCEVREAMIQWLQREYPEALPRRRGELSILGDGRHGAGPPGPDARTR
jgi:small-conductance mechanosensitive channel